MSLAACILSIAVFSKSNRQKERRYLLPGQNSASFPSFQIFERFYVFNSFLISDKKSTTRSAVILSDIFTIFFFLSTVYFGLIPISVLCVLFYCHSQIYCLCLDIFHDLVSILVYLGILNVILNIWHLWKPVTAI